MGLLLRLCSNPSACFFSGEPRLNLSATGGACLNYPLIITAVPIRGEYVEVAEWEIEWRKIENEKALNTNMETENPYVLKVENATLNHAGVYRIRAKNRYGFAEAVIHIDVVQRKCQRVFTNPN